MVNIMMATFPSPERILLLILSCIDLEVHVTKNPHLKGNSNMTRTLPIPLDAQAMRC